MVADLCHLFSVAPCSAAEKIKFHVEAAARELSLERFVNFENQLFEVCAIIATSCILKCFV